MVRTRGQVEGPAGEVELTRRQVPLSVTGPTSSPAAGEGSNGRQLGPNRFLFLSLRILLNREGWMTKGRRWRARRRQERGAGVELESTHLHAFPFGRRHCGDGSKAGPCEGAGDVALSAALSVMWAGALPGASKSKRGTPE